MRTMFRPPLVILLLVAAALALGGCSQNDAPLMPGATSQAHLSEAVSPYTLAFISRTYDSESNQTTFLYQLQNTGAPEPGPASGVLAVFTTAMVELPTCAPAPDSFSPPNGGTIYTNANGIYGVEWGVGYDDNPNLYYSITFPGNVPSGVVRGMVATGGHNYLQNITGPCEGTFQVGGIVYSDGNANAFKDQNELGIPDVTVTLTDGESVQRVKTDSDGNYLFIATTGSYTVEIDSVTADSDFNETLFAAWNATTPISYPVTVGPNSTGNNFGWQPDVNHIISGIDAGTYPTDGQSYKWWRKEYYRAIHGNTNTAYTPEQLIAFAQQINAMALLSEYNFTPGNELQEVYDILNNHSFLDDILNPRTYASEEKIELGPKTDDEGRHDPYAFLLRELLTTELNHVSGRGLEDKALQGVLIGWGEELLNDNAPSSPSPSGFVILSGSDTSTGGTLFKKINGATGGGGTN